MAKRVYSAKINLRDRSGRRLAVMLIVVFCVSAAMLGWGLGGSRVFQIAVNDNGTYQLKFFTPCRIQMLLHPRMELPGFAQLYRIADGKVVDTSSVTDFFGGNARVTWLLEDTGQVAVGRDIIFWHVHPLTPYGAMLPIRHELSP